MEISISQYSVNEKRNKFDILIIVTIASLAYGEFELLGAFTPIRLIGAFSACFIAKNWKLLIYSGFARWSLLLFFWWLYMTLSLLWTPDIMLGIIYWFHFTCIIACILLIFLSTIKANRPLHSFSLGWAFFVIITIPIALWEITSGSHLSSGSFNDGAVLGGEWKKFAAVTFANYNSYSLMLSYTLPFFMLLLKDRSISSRRLLKLFVAFLFLIVSAILLINSSRASLICLFVIVILMLIFQYKFINTIQRIFLFGIVLFLIYFVWQNMESIELFSQLLNRLDSRDSFLADDNRVRLIEMGVKISSDQLFLGGGIMSMISLFSQYKADYNYAHNLIIEMLVEYGALICILFLCYLLGTIKKLYSINIYSFRFLFYYVLFSLPFMMVIDDYYFVRSGFWIYLATIISISQTLSIIKKYKKYG